MKVYFNPVLKIIVGFIFVLNSCLGHAQIQNNENPVNVVLIICDDLNDAIEGMGGHPQVITPKIASLMEEGVCFTNAQTNSPICGPSRASMWSGLYPHTTGYYGYKQQSNHWRKNHVLKNTVTLFEQLVNNGYDVFATGKIHHNGHEDWSIFNNNDGQSGFKVGPSFGPYPWDGDPKTNNVHDRGVAHPDLPANYKSNSCWDSFGPIYDISDKMGGKGTWLYNHDDIEFKYLDENNRDLMPDERCVEYTEEVLSKNYDKPFFMAVGFNRPHSPCYVPEKYFKKYPIDSLKLAPYLENDLDDCSEIIWKDKDLGTGATGFHKYNVLNEAGGEKALLQWTQSYLASVSFIDEQIGKVVDAVKNSKYANNTLIILTSDHGYHMGEKEYIFKNTLWEESARIPLIISGLSSSKNKFCSTPVSLIDIYPTIVDYCNLPTNPNVDGNKKPLDGHSLKPLINDPDKGKWEGNDFAITAVSSAAPLELDEPANSEEQHYSIRTERYRYIYCRNGEEELYDHKTDPYEWNNLAGNKRYSKIKEKLKDKIISICY
ncbi:MAG: sulfatase [Bacteroidales bacterium]|nr:sulfatase [Bacteroidales bacterium]